MGNFEEYFLKMYETSRDDEKLFKFHRLNEYFMDIVSQFQPFFSWHAAVRSNQKCFNPADVEDIEDVEEVEEVEGNRLPFLNVIIVHGRQTMMNDSFNAFKDAMK